MANDIVQHLGLLCLGTRLKRLGERLQGEVQELIDASDVPVHAHQFPLLAALDAEGPLSIGDLVDAIGITQPGITRSVNALVRHGLVEVNSCSNDGRRRLVTLSLQGAQLVERARMSLWPRIERAVYEVCDGPGVLDHLSRIEAALAEQPLAKRAGAGEGS